VSIFTGWLIFNVVVPAVLGVTAGLIFSWSLALVVVGMYFGIEIGLLFGCQKAKETHAHREGRAAGN
jgi:hypothetical protein